MGESQAIIFGEVLVKKEFTFESAHQLPFHDGKCARLHGHSYRCVVTLKGLVQDDDPDNPQSGMVVDFSEIKAAMSELITDHLDHHNLNAIINNPTAERIAMYIFNHLWEKFRSLMYGVELWETETCSVEVRRSYG